MNLHAAVDVGSNSVKLLIGRPTGGPVDVVRDEVVVTRLSEGVDKSRRLDPAARARTLDALRGFADILNQLQVTHVVGVGTAVLRDAEDAADFVAEAAAFGVPIEIIDGDTEAEVVYLAGLHELPGIGPDAVMLDIGGASTEIIWPGGRESTELGVVRLTERHIAQDPPGSTGLWALQAAIDARLDRLPLPSAAPVVGSSASCSLVARLHLGLTAHDPGRIHGAEVPTEAIEAIAARLSEQTQAERLKWPGLEPRRADVLLAGAMVLARLARRVGAAAVRINDRGTRYGVFHRAFTATLPG